MCLSPITIPNQSHFYCDTSADQLLVQVPCGRCSECQSSRHAEWYTRTYYEVLDTLENGGSILFDTLTYSPDHLPMLSQYVDVDPSVDVPCFSYRHLRLFFYRLRKYLRPHCIRFQAVSEYGSSCTGTHRPHYHLLLFLPAALDPYVVSSMISAAWPHGRTDGLPFQDLHYIQRHIYRSLDAVTLSVAKYVSKYVFKDPFYMDVVDGRVAAAVDRHFLGQLPSDRERKMYERRVRYYTDPFHLQSLGYGLRYLRDVDASDFHSNMTISVPDSKQVVKRSSMPTYYKRKLYYDLVKVDGHYLWQPTDLGRQYLAYRDQALLKSMSLRFQQCGLSPADSSMLADYIIFHRGRSHRFDKYLSFDQRSDLGFQYPYLSLCDKDHFGFRFVSAVYLGLDGSYTSDIARGESYRSFVDSHLSVDDRCERLLDVVYKAMSLRSKRLSDVYKIEYEMKHRFKAILSPMP